MKRISKILLLLPLLAVVFYSCEEEEWSEDYDVNFPAPVINSISKEEVFVGEEITVEGENLDLTSKVMLNGKEYDTVAGSVTPTQIKFVVGRRATSGNIVVKNVYRKEAMFETPVNVMYPEVVVTKWPDKIIQGENFEIQGINVDLITEVMVGGNSVPINNPSSMESILVPTGGMPLTPGSTADIKITALGDIVESEASGIPIEEAGLTFEAVESIVLWDFEDGEPTVTDAGNASSSTYGLNLGDLPNGRGNNYFSVISNQTAGWTNFIYLNYNQEVNLSEFHAPHITMLVNTNGKRGYVNPFMTQNGVEKDNHLTNATANEAMVYGDNYAVQTEGWEWRSYPISKLFPDFNPTGTFENIKMRFTSGGVGNGDGPEDFEINVDQIMITDGLMLPAVKLFDFEDGAPEWQTSALNPTTGLNLNNNISKGAGDNYFSVSTDVNEAWKWFGNFASYNSVDLSTISDPFLSFLINTGDNKGFLQVELAQNDTKWGGGIDSSNYFVETEGEWKMISLRLSDILGNWGGDATSFNPDAAIDYLKLGFSTGNIDSGTFEVNIDNVYISDGPMW